jgi:peptidoglycan/LPS O-acetylase OafA/YrhL
MDEAGATTTIRDEARLPALASRPDVQGLRAVAVCVVILGHGHIPGFQGGFVGVDVFFVVSGFLISTLLLHEATSTGHVRVGAFYARRARRILPAAALVLIATSVFAAVELPASRVASIVGDIRWAAFFLANVHFSQAGTDYFQQGRGTSPVQHTWSLAVEEQFYLVWPVVLLLVFLLVARRRLLVTRTVVVAAWTASLVWSVLLTERSPTAAYFSSATRAWELATGALLALAGHSLARLPTRLRHVLALGGLAGIAVSVGWYDESTSFPGWRAVLPVFGTAALLAAGAAGAVGVARLLTLRPVRYVGDISYSLYLWHWPVLVLGVLLIGHLPSLQQTVVLIAVISAASVLSYHLVENPIRHQRLPGFRGLRGLALWPVVLVLVLATSGAAAAFAEHQFESRIQGSPEASRPDAALVVRHTRGANGRNRVVLPDPAVRAMIDAALRDADRDKPIPFPLVNFKHLDADLWQSKFHCYASWEESRVRLCPRGDRQASRTVVLYGDSHAGMWLPPIDLLGRRDGFRVIPLIKLGCAPFDVEQLHLGAPLPACPPFRTWALKQMRQLHPDVVLLAYRGLLEVVPDEGQSIEDAWRSGARESLHELAGITPRVEVISDISSLDFSPADCLTGQRSTMASCTQHLQPVTATGNRLTSEAARATGARFVDVTGLVCRHHRCPLVVSRVITYRDPWHVSLAWSRIVASELGRRLFRPAP